MKRVFIFIIMALLINPLIVSAQNKNKKQNSQNKNLNNVAGIKVKDTNGKNIDLSSYKGKVLLIVNVASKCGFTPQYEGLQKIYEKYNAQGFEILAFPSNDFGGQEPGTIEEIKDFCSTKYNVSFKLFDKVKVIGEKKTPLYKKLTNNTNVEPGEIKWNFEKFLVDKNGIIVKRYKSGVTPESPQLTNDIEEELKK